jgi:hypothetical protein
VPHDCNSPHLTAALPLLPPHDAGANKAVLHAAGVDHPHSVCVCYSSVARSTAAVERLRASFGPR